MNTAAAVHLVHQLADFGSVREQRANGTNTDLLFAEMIAKARILCGLCEPGHSGIPLARLKAEGIVPTMTADEVIKLTRGDD